MSRLEAAVVDAFTSTPFSGNPAAVVVLPPAAQEAGDVQDDAWLQRVAAEFAVGATAFIRPREDGSWHLRWFTPLREIALCGHGTLAAAHVLWERQSASASESAARLSFRTLSGDLGASRDGEGRIVLDFPLRPVVDVDPVPGVEEALGVETSWVGRTSGATTVDRYGLAVVSATDLVKLRPDLSALARLEFGGLIVTARPDAADATYDGVDVISRFFSPAVGIPEDPVTGSAHCTLGDYWGTELDRAVLRCRQVSPRGGQLTVTRSGGRALLAGTAVTVWDVTIR